MQLFADVVHSATKVWHEVAEYALSWAQAQVQNYAGAVRIAPEAI
jgi:phospholipase/lecithinase/hemolysin